MDYTADYTQVKNSWSWCSLGLGPSKVFTSCKLPLYCKLAVYKCKLADYKCELADYNSLQQITCNFPDEVQVYHQVRSFVLYERPTSLLGPLGNPGCYAVQWDTDGCRSEWLINFKLVPLNINPIDQVDITETDLLNSFLFSAHTTPSFCPYKLRNVHQKMHRLVVSFIGTIYDWKYHNSF